MLVYLKNKQLLLSKLPTEWGSADIPIVTHNSVVLEGEELLTVHVSPRFHAAIDAVVVVMCNPLIPTRGKRKDRAHLDPIRGA